MNPGPAAVFGVVFLEMSSHIQVYPAVAADHGPPNCPTAITIGWSLGPIPGKCGERLELSPFCCRLPKGGGSLSKLPPRNGN
jgi:hypothetical protein